MRWQWFGIAACLGVLAYIGVKAVQSASAGATPERVPSRVTVDDGEPPKPVVEKANWAFALPEASAPKREWVRGADAVRRLERAVRAGSPGSPIEDVCRRWVGGACVEHALDRFEDALDRLVSKERQADVNIVAMGNSLIAADGIVGTVRARLTERFGDGGKGFVYAERISDYGQRNRCGWGTKDGWTPFNLAMGPRGRYPYALGSEHHVSNFPGARTRINLEQVKRAELYLFEHKSAPPVEVRAGSASWTFKPARDNKMHRYTLDVPLEADRLEVIARGKNAVVQGISLDSRANGVVVDTIGIPAVDADRFMRTDPEMFEAQLKERDPALVMLMLGGVENRRVGWRKYGYPTVRDQLRELIARVQHGAPDASCLVVGPIDATYGPLDEKVLGRPFPGYRGRKEIPVINRIQREVALQMGCAYYDQWAAQGGPGSLKRWDKQGLMWKDLVHPRSSGLALLGDLLAESLRAHYTSPPARFDEQRIIARRAARPAVKRVGDWSSSSAPLNAIERRAKLKVFANDAALSGFRAALGQRVALEATDEKSAELSVTFEEARACASTKGQRLCIEAAAELDDATRAALIAEALMDAVDEPRESRPAH